jgi:uncharacterized membrane protein YhiD involved in acid resistance
MAVGVGAWFLATAATLIIWIVLRVVRKVEIEKLRPEPTDES